MSGTADTGHVTHVTLMLYSIVFCIDASNRCCIAGDAIVVVYRNGIVGKAKKVFLSTDLCGQQYLCYLIALKNQLK